MEFIKSFWLFLKGILKRLYWLIPSLLADPFDIADRWFKVSYEAPDWLVWVLVMVGFVIAAILTYHDLRMQNLKLAQEPKTTIKLQPRKLDMGVYFNLKRQTEDKHGHDDNQGIRYDMQEGTDPNDIMGRNCSKCDKPRNQKGDPRYDD